MSVLTSAAVAAIGGLSAIVLFHPCWREPKKKKREKCVDRRNLMLLILAAILLLYLLIGLLLGTQSLHDLIALIKSGF